MFNTVNVNETQQVHDAIANLLINRSGEWFTTATNSGGETKTFHTSLVGEINNNKVYFIYDEDSYLTLTKNDTDRLIEILNKHQSIQNNIIHSRINKA